MRLLALLAALLGQSSPDIHGETAPPNVIWITIDDVGPDFGCYGNTHVHTPTLDRLAAEGQRFTNCFVTTPVCSPVRSALITGNYATTIGSHQHRSNRPLPEGYLPITDHLRAAGYRTEFLPWQRVSVANFEAGIAPEEGAFLTVTGRNKLDYNFSRGGEEKHFTPWSDSKRPFFAVIDFNSPKTGSFRAAHQYAQLQGREVDPQSLALPPYWPDEPQVRSQFARHHEGISLLDAEIAAVFDWLEREGLREQTNVFIWGDHGRAFLRHKQWCYDSGLRVPLIVVGPQVPPAIRTELVSSIDLAASTLAACGIPLPSVMEGRDFLKPDAAPRGYIFASRDRCDETEDRVRAVRDNRFKLIHNYHPDRPWVGRNAYARSAFPSVNVLLARKATGTLPPSQAIFMANTKPEWELYDTTTDPWEMKNLAEDSTFAGDLMRLKGLLDAWVRRTDAGNPFPESLETITPGNARERVTAQRNYGPD